MGHRPLSAALAYKVLTTAQWAALRDGSFAGAPVDIADGYIHLSTAAQLSETVRRHFAGQEGLIVAAVDLARVAAALRWEVSRGGALFPHLYGRLHVDDVVAAAALAWREGEVVLPMAP